MTTPQHPLCKGCGEAILTKIAFQPVPPSIRFCESCETVCVFEGYTRAQLSDAFDSVKNQENWKMPIDKSFPTVMLAKSEMDKITAAVVFYAGCKPTFTREWLPATSEQNRRAVVRVQAPGYYVAVGA